MVLFLTSFTFLGSQRYYLGTADSAVVCSERSPLWIVRLHDQPIHGCLIGLVLRDIPRALCCIVLQYRIEVYHLISIAACWNILQIVESSKGSVLVLKLSIQCNI
jgi:hypothetical protein